MNNSSSTELAIIADLLSYEVLVVGFDMQSCLYKEGHNAGIMRTSDSNTKLTRNSEQVRVNS